MKTNNDLRYIAYVRKSSEDKEKQELSHLGQIDAIKQQYSQLNIVKWMEPESRSAFTPGRLIFNEMMDMIDRGEADGIVTWYPNRLSRNELDTARVTYALRGPLKDLKFCSYTFESSPEGIWMLQNIMNQGQFESSKQGREVRRGMKVKASQGEKPGKVLPGYMKVPILDKNGNPVIKPRDMEIITKTDIDPERFDKVRQMWDWLLYDHLPPQQIWKKVNEELDYKTRSYRDRKSSGLKPGGPMPKSMVYRIFRSEFYTGEFMHMGVLNKGKYRPMITWDEYKLAQHILGSKGNPKASDFEYAFASMIRCGECGCTVQARHLTKLIKRDNQYKTYVYYYCSRKSIKRPCTQTIYTSVESIERNIDEELSKYTIIPEFKDLALKILRRNHKLEVKDRLYAYEAQQKRRTQIQDQRDKLLDYLHREIIDEEEFKYQRNRLQIELSKVDELLRGSEKRADDWMIVNEEAFDFAANARARFATGSMEVKRNILKTFGQAFTLKDNRLYIEPNEWLLPIEEKYPEIEDIYMKVGTNQKASSKELEKALGSKIQLWRAHRDLNPGHQA